MSQDNNSSISQQTYNVYYVRETRYTGMEEDDSRTCESKTYFEIVDASQDDFQSDLHGNEDYNLRYYTSCILKDFTQSEILKLGHVFEMFERGLRSDMEVYTRSTAHEAIDADYGP